jgi:cysteine-S-conjugate beta-lyase
MGYDFDCLISRRDTNALAEDGFENYLFGSDAPAPVLDVPREELISMLRICSSLRRMRQSTPSASD